MLQAYSGDVLMAKQLNKRLCISLPGLRPSAGLAMLVDEPGVRRSSILRFIEEAKLWKIPKD